MKRNGQTQREIEALGDLVDRFGADRTRWPAPDRLRFASLLQDSSEARKLLAEASAFDRLLDMAPTVGGERRAALADRIVAEAMATQADRPGAGSVTDLAAARLARRPQPRIGARFGNSAWPAAALLAASLVLGIFAGSSGLLPSASFGLSSTASASDADFEGRVLALGPDVGSFADEDTL